MNVELKHKLEVREAANARFLFIIRNSVAISAEESISHEEVLLNMSTTQ